MAYVLLAFGSAFAASCVWLTVRIINRRERWAKWTLAITLALPVLHILSFGPACWISSRTNIGVPVVNVVYLPMIWLCDVSPEPVGTAILWHSQVGADDGWYWSTEDMWGH